MSFPIAKAHKCSGTKVANSIRVASLERRLFVYEARLLYSNRSRGNDACFCGENERMIYEQGPTLIRVRELNNEKRG